MSTTTTIIIIIATLLGVGLLIGALIFKIYSFKTKQKPTADQQILKDKLFFKKFKPIKFKDWNKNDSGIVIASGIKRGSKINNNFVIQNLHNTTSKLKKINYKSLAICKTDKKSSICIAPPGSGKTQTLLLPTILYLVNCEEKPNLIITDPKPEIYENVNFELIKNGYNIINLSTIELIDQTGKLITDFYNPLDLIKKYHQELISANDEYKKHDLFSKIQDEINNLTSYFKIDDKPDYWKDNALGMLQFLIAWFLYQVEMGNLTYEQVNFYNLKTNLDTLTYPKLMTWVKETKTKSELFSIKNLCSRYLKWASERAENVNSFMTNCAGLLDIFNQMYFGILTSKTTFDLDAIIQSNKPFVIFLTINTSSQASVQETMLLKIWLSLICKKIDYYKRVDQDFKNRSIWWLLDEAGNLPKLEFLKSIIAFGRGRNEFALPIFQSEIQMKNIYDYELIDSCEYKILFASDNDKFANKISTVAGTYKTQDELNRTTTTKNLELENIVNIPSGFLGLSLIKRFRDDKNFYIAPVTYWYMLQGVGLSKKFKLKSNDKYLLTNYTKILDDGSNNPKTGNVEAQSTRKQWKFSWLKINEDQLNQDNKSRCLQLMNNIVNHLNYFKYHQELIPTKIQAIQNSFTSLQALTQNQLTDSLIAEFLTACQANKNIMFEKDNKDNENKAQD